MKRFAWIFILTALFAVSAMAYIPAPESERFVQEDAPTFDYRFECDLGVKYPSMSLTTADWIRLRVPRRYAEKPYVRLSNAGWVICHNNPVMYVDTDGRDFHAYDKETTPIYNLSYGRGGDFYYGDTYLEGALATCYNILPAASNFLWAVGQAGVDFVQIEPDPNDPITPFLAMVSGGSYPGISAGFKSAWMGTSARLSPYTSKATGVAKKLWSKGKKLLSWGDDIGEAIPGTLDDVATRKWYHSQLDKIPSLIDSNQTLRNQAKQAFDLRNQAKRIARSLMADREKAALLEITDPIPTWSEMLWHANNKGYTGSGIYEYILGSATHSRPGVDAALGLT